MAVGIHSLIPGPSDERSVGEQDTATSPVHVEGTHEQIPVADIRANTFQPRTSFDDDALAGLAASITSLGVLQPILVRRDGDAFELIAGERRWRAAQLAGLTVIPALVREIADERSLEEALVENVQRQDLNAIDEAFAYQQLMEDFRLSQAEVARRLGKNRATIANAIRLLRLPGSLRQLISAGKISAGHGRALLMVDDVPEQARIAAECVSGGWSVRQLEAMVRTHEKSSLKRNGAKPNSGPKKRSKDPRKAGLSSTAALEVETQLGDLFDTSVEVVNKGGRQQLVIDFADTDDLSRIVALILHPGS